MAREQAGCCRSTVPVHDGYCATAVSSMSSLNQSSTAKIRIVICGIPKSAYFNSLVPTLPVSVLPSSLRCSLATKPAW